MSFERCAQTQEYQLFSMKLFNMSRIKLTQAHNWREINQRMVKVQLYSELETIFCANSIYMH